MSGGYAAIVIPLTCDGELDQNRLCAAVNLGDYTNMPFVCKNYEKTVWPSSESLYIVSFSLELKQDRTNGNYPVSVDITVTDKMGNQVQKTITVLPLLTTEMTRYLRMGRMKKAYLPQRSTFSHMNVRPFQTVARRTLLKPATG